MRLISNLMESHPWRSREMRERIILNNIFPSFRPSRFTELKLQQRQKEAKKKEAKFYIYFTGINIVANDFEADERMGPIQSYNSNQSDFNSSRTENMTEEMILSFSGLTDMPAGSSKSRSTQVCYLDFNQISRLPSKVVFDRDYPNLVELYLASNGLGTEIGLSYLPTRLEVLDLSANKLGKTGAGALKFLTELKQLRMLSLSSIELTDEIFENFSEFENLSHMRLADNQFVDAALLFQMLPPSLTRLEMSINHLLSNWDDCNIAMNLPRLSLLDVSECSITRMPNSFLQLSELTVLNMSVNLLREIPKSLNDALPKLQKLFLEYNLLGSFPISALGITSLLVLDLDCNPLWVAFPPTVDAAAAEPIPSIDNFCRVQLSDQKDDFPLAGKQILQIPGGPSKSPQDSGSPSVRCDRVSYAFLMPCAGSSSEAHQYQKTAVQNSLGVLEESDNGVTNAHSPSSVSNSSGPGHRGDGDGFAGVIECCRCRLPFGVLRWRHRCIACAFTFCTDCSARRVMSSGGSQVASSGPTARICHACFEAKTSSRAAPVEQAEREISSANIGGDVGSSSNTGRRGDTIDASRKAVIAHATTSNKAGPGPRISGLFQVPDLIVPSVFLGSWPCARNVSLLESLGVTHILCVAEFVSPYPSRFTYHVVMLPDKDSSPLIDHFEDCCEFIDRAVASGNKILIHCRAGVSRSATVTAAYIMRRYGLCPAEALEHIKQRRSKINPRGGFRAQLAEWETRIHPTSPS